MIGTYDLVVEATGVAVTLSAVAVCAWRRLFTRYFFLNFYLLTSAVFTSGCYYIRSTYGYTSIQYRYFYYTGDALIMLVGYLLIASFFDHMFRRSALRAYVRLTLAIFFFLVIGVSGLFISRNVTHLYSRFAIELQRNMFFVGALLTFLLWISMSYLRAESRRFMLLVSGLGIYFSAHAANLALWFVFRGVRAGVSADEVVVRVPPLAYTFMVLLWLYTFWRIPEGEPATEPIPRAKPRQVPVKLHISPG